MENIYSVDITHKEINQYIQTKTINEKKLNYYKGREGIYAYDITLPLEIFKELINKYNNESLDTGRQDPDSQKICFIVDKQEENIQISPEDFDTIRNMCKQNNNYQTTEPQPTIIQGYLDTQRHLQGLREDSELKKKGITPPLLRRASLSYDSIGSDSDSGSGSDFFSPTFSSGSNL
jgi:hypothetical protein